MASQLALKLFPNLPTILRQATVDLATALKDGGTIAGSAPISEDGQYERIDPVYRQQPFQGFYSFKRARPSHP